MAATRLIVVIMQLLVHLAASKPMFYIYEWPNYLDDVWPTPNNTLSEKTGYHHGFRAHRGAGRPMEPDVGLFQTWQFSLYRNLMARLRFSEYRTRDPSKASAFLIPFDLGVHSYINETDGRPRLAAPHGRFASRYLKQNCQGPNKNLWWKNNGHDHFLIFSITAYQMVGMMVKEFFMFVCQNCTTITIETSPTGTAPPGRTRKHWYAAPYPSSFHWWDGIKELPWDSPGSRYQLPPDYLRTGGLLAPSESSSDSVSQFVDGRIRLPGELAADQTVPDKYRDIISLFIGSVKTSQDSSRLLRRKLYSQCTEAGPVCQWHTTAHSCTGVVNASNSMLLFKRAQYCPAPAGDSLTRKSLFDALVSGCVPVLFSRASLTQYKWHLSQKDVDDVAVYIPMNDILNKGINYIEYLKNISPAELARKQAAIKRLAPSLQFSIVPDNLVEFQHIWRPPYRDAADVIIEKILDRKTIEPVQGYTYEELKNLNLEQKMLFETSEDYATLRPKEKIVPTGGKTKTLKAIEDDFVERAVTKISRVCDSDDPNGWGPSSEPKANKKGRKDQSFKTNPELAAQAKAEQLAISKDRKAEKKKAQSEGLEKFFA